MTEQRIGDWIGMASGRQFWPLDPRAAEVDAHDIAQALANLCRFGGRCRAFYSVAQHSVWVADYCARLWPGDSALHLHALMHDAAEAYVGDVVSPLKPAVHVLRGDRFEQFRDTEERIMRAIRAHVGISAPTPAMVDRIRTADVAALAVEARDLMGDPKWPGMPEPVGDKLVPMDPVAARYAFTFRLGQLLTELGEAVGA